MLIYLAFPAAHGCAAEIDDAKSLISKPGENHIFAAASAEKARMALFSVSLSCTGKEGAGRSWRRVDAYLPMKPKISDRRFRRQVNGHIFAVGRALLADEASQGGCRRSQDMPSLVFFSSESENVRTQ